MSYRIFIAEDHQLFAEGLKSLLSASDDIEIIGMAATGAETYKALHLENIDILLLDLHLPDTNGVEIIDFITNNALKTKIIVVSMYYERSYVNLARKRGAHGYVPKNVGKNQLLSSIRKVMEFGSYFEEVLDGHNHLVKLFTPREYEILELLKTGYDTNKIAITLQISYQTVRTHRKNILKKAKANNIVKLLNFVNAQT